MSALRVVMSSISIAAIFFGSGCGESPEGEYRQYTAADHPAPEVESAETSFVDDDDSNSNATDDSTSSSKAGDADTEEADSNSSQQLSPSDNSDSGNKESTENSTADASKSENKKTVELVNYEPKQIEKREIKLLIPEKDFQADADGVIRVSYDDIDLLKVLNMEPVPTNAADYFPNWLKDLNGKRIRIRGFMFPPPRRTGIEFFQLARDNEICCFGKQAKIYDKFPVEMRSGVTTDYIFSRPFDVVGKFVIDPFEDDGELYELFRIEDAIIIEK